MKKIVLLISITSMFFVAGCGANVDIRIVELGSMLRYDVSVTGNYRETILSINEDKKCFYTLQRFGNKNFKLRTRDFNGKETNMETIPLFSEFYCSPENTVSPDGRDFIYLDRKDNAIKSYNLDSRTSGTLLPNAGSGMSIMMMEFISDDTMIIALDEDEDVGRSECQIIQYNIASKTHKILVKPVKLSGYHYSFSPSKKYLAFWEGGEKHSIYGDIKLLDISTGKIIATIESIKEDCLLSCPCWSQDGNKIGYVESKTIKVFDIQSKTTKNVKTFADNLICHELKFTDNEHLIYILIGFGKGSETHCIDQPLQILEIATGRDVKMINNFESNGDLFVVEEGKRIIGEVGF